MAFDMYLDGQHESIGHNEEFIFSMAYEHRNIYPKLCGIWDSLYKDPRISPQEANDIVHELIHLFAENGGAANKSFTAIVTRLLPFFSSAYRDNKEIRCASD